MMARYGLWQFARIEQVRDNLQNGVVEVEDTVAFDTTHVEANSHCANVVPEDAKVQEGKMPKHRKVPRMRKSCACGKQQWESCEHTWTPTDQGAGVVASVAAVTGVESKAGASLPSVTVTAMDWVTTPPLPSSTCTVMS